MQELTLILFGASIAMGAGVAFVRKPSSSAFMLSTVMSLLAVCAVLTDSEVASAEGYGLTLMVVAPLVVFIYSMMSWVFGREARRWRSGGRRRTCSRKGRSST